jgi:tetratricopeptide (TPR) repeat protein
VTFVPRKRLFGSAGIHTDYSETSFPLESAEPILRARIDRESPANRHLFLRALYNKCLRDGSSEDVQRVRDQALAEGIAADELDEKSVVESILIPKGWEAYGQHDFITARMLAERCLAGRGIRSVHAVALLGMSMLRLGELEGARSCIDEVAARLPDSLRPRLYRAELDLAENRYHEAEARALHVLENSHGDEDLITSSLALLEQAWEGKGLTQDSAEALAHLASGCGKSPTFLAHLAQAQLKLGRRDVATRNVEKALELAPGHELASKLKAECGTKEPGLT